MPARLLTLVSVPVLARTSPRESGNGWSNRWVSEPVKPATGSAVATAFSSGCAGVEGQPEHLHQRQRRDPVLAGQPAAVVDVEVGGDPEALGGSG